MSGRFDRTLILQLWSFSKLTWWPTEGHTRT